jgi:hypothetical protein
VPRPPGQSDEDRALQELVRRRASSRPAPGEEDARPVPVEEDDVTSPHELIDPARYQTDAEYKQQWDDVLRQFGENAAYRLLWMRVGRAKRESSGPVRAAANAALQASADANRVGDFDDELHRIDGELKSIVTTMKIAKWILGFFIAATLASIVTVATKVFDWGMSTGEADIRLQTLEKDVSAVQHQLDALLKGGKVTP